MHFKIKLTISLFVIYCNTSLSIAQVYKPFQNSLPNKDSLIQVVTDLNEKYKIDASKEMQEVYDDILKCRIFEYNSSGFIYDEDYYMYLKKVLAIILKANEGLSSTDIRLHVSNSPWPNAYSTGDGTIAINVGLLRRLETEAQLAFILCHEIAHFILEHREERLKNRFAYLESDEYKEQIKDLKFSSYGRFSKSQEILRHYTYNTRKHSRKNESAADSLAFIYLSNTKYSAADAIACINVLDKSDSYKYGKKIKYDSVFHFDDYKFRHRWMELESSLFDNDMEQISYFNHDSVKTHPDCHKRANDLRLSLLNNVFGEQMQYVVDSSYFLRLRDTMDYEFLIAWKQLEDYDHGLFYSIKHLQNSTDDINYKLYLTEFWYLIYKAQKDHRLSEYVAKPNKEYEPEFNQFLEFLDNLRLSEMANIGHRLHKRYLAELKDSEEFVERALFFSNELGISNRSTGLK